MGDLVCEYPNFSIFVVDRPFNSGHVVIAPKRALSLDSVDDEALAELYNILVNLMRALEELYKPHGYNIMIGQRDLYIEVVPRWNGDVNFMPIFFNTKVIPELPSQCARNLRERLCR